MATAFIRARVINSTSLALMSHAVIVREDSGRFAIVYEAAGDSPVRNIFRPADGVRHSWNFSCGNAADLCISWFPEDISDGTTSFVTFATWCNECTRGVRLETYGGVVEMNDVFNYDLGEIFARDAHNRSVQAGGIAIKEGYTQTQIYTGFSGYHSNQRSHRFNTPLETDKPWRIGVELELYAKNGEAYNTITHARSNWFQCESDSSLRDDTAHGAHSRWAIEMKTIPLKACDATSTEFWAAPMARLKQLAISKEVSYTGLHVHIGKEILGSSEGERQATLDKLSFFYVYHIEDVPEAHAKNVIICGRERGYCMNENYGKSELADLAKDLGVDAKGVCASAAFNRIAGDVRGKVASTRGDINLNNLNSYGTVEFRKGKGIIGKTRLAAICTWWEQMCLYCRETPARELDFNTFFTRVCGSSPAVAYFFNEDNEC